MSTQAHDTPQRGSERRDLGWHGEGAMGSKAGDSEIARPPGDRARLIELEIARQEAVLNRLRKDHEGKPGRWNWQDTEIKHMINSNLKLLAAGVLPSEQTMSQEGIFSVAASHNAGLLARAEYLGASSLCQLGTKNVTSDSAGSQCGTLNSASRSIVSADSTPEESLRTTLEMSDDRSSDMGDSAGEEEERDSARESERSGISESVKKRLDEVLKQSKHGCLSTAGSSVYYPEDPAKSARCCSFQDGAAPVIYVEAPHIYHASRGLPTQPPCPRHGWEAVYDGHIESRGWTDGRRVLGTLEDCFLVGTKHVCRKCRRERADLKKSYEECCGGQEEKETRLAAMKRCSYSFRSYDPEVTSLYRVKYPWITAKVVVCSRSTAMTRELALFLRRSVQSGVKPHEVTTTLKKLREAHCSLDEAVRFTFDHYSKPDELRVSHRQVGLPDSGRRLKRVKSGGSSTGTQDRSSASSTQEAIVSSRKRGDTDRESNLWHGSSLIRARSPLPGHMLHPREPLADSNPAVTISLQAMEAVVPQQVSRSSASPETEMLTDVAKTADSSTR